MSEPGERADFPPVVIGIETDTAIFNLPDGPIEGWRVRYELNVPGTPETPPHRRWSEWMFVPSETLSGLLALYRRLLTERATQGGLVPPGTSVQ